MIRTFTNEPVSQWTKQISGKHKMPYKNKDKQREFQKAWMRQRRKDYFKDKHCEKCGSTIFLVIHHRDPKEKISHKIWSWGEERRKVELEKCDVLCNPCHREYHAELIRDKEHGTCGMYKREKCRCDLCRKWNRDKRRDYRAKRANNLTDKVPAL